VRHSGRYGSYPRVPANTNAEPSGAREAWAVPLGFIYLCSLPLGGASFIHWWDPMSNNTPRRGASAPGELPESLTARVAARVTDAGLAVDRRASASRPKSRRSRPAATGTLQAPVSQTPEELRERQSLRRVFHDLGHSYRRYRRRTGEPVKPAVREAAYKFRQEPSLTSLVSVAAFLDELEILTW